MENTHLPEDFKDFLKLLNENEVQYLLIGGYAVGYYGYPRATHDMDIWIAVDPENAEKMIDVNGVWLRRRCSLERDLPYWAG